MRVCPQNVTQKHYLDEGGFGVIYSASVKLQVSSYLVCLPQYVTQSALVCYNVHLNNYVTAGSLAPSMLMSPP